MGRTDWAAEEVRWAQQIEAVVGGVRAWRAAHPRATFREIAEAIDAELSPLRAQMLAEAAGSSPAARFTAASGEERPGCRACGGKLAGRGRRRRRVTTRGDATVEVEREYGVCATCGQGVFPPGRGAGAGPGDVRPVDRGEHRLAGDGDAVRTGAAGGGPVIDAAGEHRDGPAADGGDRRDAGRARGCRGGRSEEHTSELQSRRDLVCRLLLEKKNV